MKATIKFLCYILIFTTTFNACSDNKKKESAEKVETKKDSTTSNHVTLTTEQYKVAGIQLGTIEMRNLSSVIKVNGVIDVPPQNIVSISALLGGYLKSAGLIPGQVVRKGQVIAVIENAEFIDIQEDYLESSSRMVFLSQDLKRQQELRKEEVNAAKTLQQVSSEYNMMRAKISGLEQKLSLIGISTKALQAGTISKTCNLYSPINGYVAASNVNRGKYVQPSDVLFELANKSDMHLALNVFEKDVRKLDPGQPIRFSLANETDYNRTAKVFLIGKSTEADGTIPVHCHLAISNDSSLLPGMYVKALIETTAKNLPALPIEAVIQSEAKDYIFIQLDTTKGKIKFKMIPVIKGIEQEGYVAITFPGDFNSANAKIVTKGAYSLLSAMKNVEE
jgi:cobalt-zinc-cadmium efflux system membrane fusion protein